jgi:8-oxo-dGTP pyrophosphatase MutT (NUDIX family)
MRSGMPAPSIMACGSPVAAEAPGRNALAILPRVGSPHQPEITVAAIAEAQGRFLLVEERINNRLVINQPAGHVEHGESLLAAVIREAREETAWLFAPQELIGVYRWTNPRNGQTTMRFAFGGTVADHNAAQPLDDGIVGTHWLSRAELLGHQDRLRSPLVMRCIDDYLGGRRVPLSEVAHLDLCSAQAVAAVEV